MVNGPTWSRTVWNVETENIWLGGYHRFQGEVPQGSGHRQQNRSAGLTNPPDTVMSHETSLFWDSLSFIRLKTLKKIQLYLFQNKKEVQERNTVADPKMQTAVRTCKSIDNTLNKKLYLNLYL